MNLLIAVLLWLLVLLSPTSHEALAPLAPDGCTFFEDGALICATFTLPPYDDVMGD